MTWACRTLVALLSISAVRAQDGGAKASSSLYWQPWMTAFAAVTVFLFIVFAGLIMNRVLCAKGRGNDESSTKLNIEERTSASGDLCNPTMDNDKITNL
ncbi:small integral membrane protein 24 [Narcine bancroftii]|uniref:small integral membrane protein 24 n=1 Tax=Narcine bancroftii TaxID=1343680 RepID=UPI003831FD80